MNPYYQRQNVGHWFLFLDYKVYADIRWGSWEGVLNDSGVVDIFG